MAETYTLNPLAQKQYFISKSTTPPTTYNSSDEQQRISPQKNRARKSISLIAVDSRVYSRNYATYPPPSYAPHLHDSFTMAAHAELTVAGGTNRLWSGDGVCVDDPLELARG
jgi:hypothetical protein